MLKCKILNASVRKHLVVLSLIFTFFSNVLIPSVSGEGLENLRCIICKQIIQDLRGEIEKVDPKKTVEVGNYRLDAKGDSKHNVIPYALSEMHIMDSLETVCKGIDDYVRVIHKETGELMLLKLIINGAMNPDMSNVDVVQDGDLNKSLKYYCDGIIEEYEESIIRLIQSKETEIENKLCVEEAKLCMSQNDIHDDL